MTKTGAADRVHLCIVPAASSESTNLENIAKCLYPCPDMRHFMMVIRKTLAFRYRN